MKTAKKSGWIRVCSVLIFLPASLTWTDGGYVSSRISESLAVSADQRAILIKNGNDISMTFSTGYTGEGEDFGWIIPISVPPAIEDIAESGKDGIASFAFLDEITAPVIVTEIYSHKGCFPAGTTVHTAEGSRVIEAVSPGTEVYACDPTTGKWVLAKVLKLQSFQWEGDMVTVQMGRYSIQTTGNQPIYVVSGDRLSSRPIPGEVSIEDQRSTGPGRWVEARNLEKGDRLKDRKGNGQVITGLSSQYQKTRVYCLEVEHYHNCAVHSAGILAHNGGKQGKSEEVNLMPLVTVYGKVILEHYEVTVLGADDASALLEWLQENDYQVSLEARSIFENSADLPTSHLFDQHDSKCKDHLVCNCGKHGLVPKFRNDKSGL